MPFYSCLADIDRASTAQDCWSALVRLARGLGVIEASYKVIPPFPEWSFPGSAGESLDTVARACSRTMEWRAGPEVDPPDVEEEREGHWRLRDIAQQAFTGDAGTGIAFPLPDLGDSLHRVLVVRGWSDHPHPQILRGRQEALHLAALNFDAKVRLLGFTAERGGINLSNREKHCLVWAAAGKSSHEIGVILGITERAVNWHLAEARRKLGTATRIQAVVKAVRLGIIVP